MLKNKNIILGVTGSIAAYKTATLIRNLIAKGANVKVVMTPLAKEFITPLTLATLSKNPVLVDFFNPVNGDWNNHVDLGQWADIMLIAPATANTIAKMAHGIADNLLLTTYLSAKCPVLVAPAMDLSMFQHQTTTKNIDILKSYGITIIEPDTGELASGLSGKGRMEEPDGIVERLEQIMASKKKLLNKKFLITAGPTQEAIDPIRYISNHSSGKMGYAIANAIAERGGEVYLVTGPVSVTTANASIKMIPVVSAQEMYKECIALFPKMDAAILSAAVADYTPVNRSQTKLKRKEENRSIQLQPTKDIAYELGKRKKKNQVLIGFALETDNEVENARKKMSNKNLDFIILNLLRDEGAGFGFDTNKVTIMDRNNNIEEYELKDKHEVAKDIIQHLCTILP